MEEDMDDMPYDEEKKICTRLPTDFGEFNLFLYSGSNDNKEHLAIVKGDIAGKENVLTRVHSECFTGEILCSQRCDCREQLQNAMKMIEEEGQGVIVYLRQEGRGIGLSKKLSAYNLQDKGFDTVDANLALGHQPDERDYTAAASILKDLQVFSVMLITNNPEKISQLEQSGISVTRRIPAVATINENNHDYLYTKATRMNHMLDLPFSQNLS
jgi:GTP cyclohydrolase II